MDPLLPSRCQVIFSTGDGGAGGGIFRALLLLPNNKTHARLDAPSSSLLSRPPCDRKDAEKSKTVDLAMERDVVFTTAVGHNSKRVLAVCQVTTPEEVVEHMLYLVCVSGSAYPTVVYR